MQDSMDMGLQLLRVIGSLALVLIILFAGLFALKRWGHWMKKSTASAWIQILAQHSFGPKHHLLVVKVQEEMFLVGVSPQGMHYLSALSGASEVVFPKADGE